MGLTTAKVIAVSPGQFTPLILGKETRRGGPKMIFEYQNSSFKEKKNP